MFRYEKPVKGRKINWMKAAILEACRVLTVSPHYAQELISGVDRGVELHSYLRTKTVSGIVNGMDVQEWNPATDKYIDIKYDITTVRYSLEDQCIRIEEFWEKPLQIYPYTVTRSLTGCRR